MSELKLFAKWLGRFEKVRSLLADHRTLRRSPIKNWDALVRVERAIGIQVVELLRDED